MTEFENISFQILNAKFPEDIFGDMEIDINFRRLSRIVHPDINHNSKEANDAFVKLHDFYKIAKKKISDGSYGKKDLFTIKIKNAEYSARNRLFSLIVSDIYSTDKLEYLEISKNPKYNNFLTEETKIIKDNKYFPKYVNSITVNNQVCNVFEFQITPNMSIQNIIDQNKIVHPRTIAWIFNRMLEGLGFLHNIGYVHGSVIPANIVLDTDQHGISILGLTSSIKNNSKVKFHSDKFKEYFPGEIINNRIGVFQSDIYMAVKTILSISSDLPQKMNNLFKACVIENPNRRPNNVWELRERFEKEVLIPTFGKSVFHPFELIGK